MASSVKTIERPLIATKADQAKPFRYFSWGLPIFAVVWALLYFNLAKDPVGGFCTYWSLIPVGIATGILANISAVGGGLVLIPTMIFFWHFPAVMALKMTLASQSIGLTSGSIAWYRTGKIPLKLLLYTVPGLLVGSTISSLVIHPSAFLVKTVFGPVSILIGLVTLFMLNKGTEDHHTFEPKHLPLFLVSVLGGLVTGWISIGEGELIAAYLMLVCGFGYCSQYWFRCNSTSHKFNLSYYYSFYILRRSTLAYCRIYSIGCCLWCTPCTIFISMD